MTIPELKQRLPLPELLLRLGLFDYLPATGTHRCPLHQEKLGESFSLFLKDNVWFWKCHGACGSAGDEISLIALAGTCSRKEAIRRYQDLAGASVPQTYSPSPLVNATPPGISNSRKSLALPRDLDSGSRGDLEVVATLRRVDFWAVATMQQNGVLAFGTVCGVRCWIVLDQARLCAEARRMDGACFASGRKVHTLCGSDKSWPVGLQLPRGLTRYFQRFLLVEGSGDLVAAYHWALRLGQDCLPIALLGAGIKRIHPDALEQLRGKSVRIIPHDDPAGHAAVEPWQMQLRSVNCTVYLFRMSRIEMPDGTCGKDLNDTTGLPPEECKKMEGLFSWM